MKVLILGGTGAIGVALKERLLKRGDEVFITSRKAHQTGNENIHYLVGNAHNNVFLEEILRCRYDAIVDLMSYESEEFRNRVYKLVHSTEHYIFTSSSRVFADQREPINEESPRLLDVCKDKDFLQTDDYALAKAREEDMLFSLRENNWTIVRPYITYNIERLQLGFLEKETWLRRGIGGYSIPLPKDIAQCQTTMTYAGDVANVIIKLICNDKAYRETYNITGTEHLTWRQVANIYCDTIEAETGIRPVLYESDTSYELSNVWGTNFYHITYDRLYNRVFDNSKIMKFCGTDMKFASMENGLNECLKKFIRTPKWKYDRRDTKLDSYLQKKMCGNSPFTDYDNYIDKITYLGWYYVPELMTKAKELVTYLRQFG